jgi:hypothetical protein
VATHLGSCAILAQYEKQAPRKERQELGERCFCRWCRLEIACIGRRTTLAVGVSERDMGRTDVRRDFINLCASKRECEDKRACVRACMRIARLSSSLAHRCEDEELAAGGGMDDDDDDERVTVPIDGRHRHSAMQALRPCA